MKDPEFMTPGEALKEIARRADIAAMERADMTNAIYGLFRELGQDHLFALSNLLNMIASLEDPAVGASHFEGYAKAILELKFDVCPSHNINHARVELEGEFAPEDNSNASTKTRDDSENIQSLENPALIKRYRLVKVEGFLYCDDCGMRYPSLEDRMIKEPDDCPGCHTKSAHG